MYGIILFEMECAYQ